ncbi:hypothetical protein ONZ51_g4638 [Trametes cubensis]|uniref:GAF domain-containing protein n=1 Tax=Trametes cubensis TaxID=1111947 RepID=A0AAD7TWH1_9APHY|nr:hypothetical protein ONZ51_g4638 [Trametes cubensis]
MPHADSATIPAGIDKAAFWAHVHEQLSHLLDGQRNWVTNLANASSLVFNALQAFPPFGTGERMVNWCGHIACDGETKSEVVCPLLLTVDGEERAIGVLDLDCLALAGFDEQDQAGLEKIARLVVDACDW